MLDHLLGCPSTTWKRIESCFTSVFFIWFLIWGSDTSLSFRFLDAFLHSMSPRQIVIATLALCYLFRNFDKFFGFSGPEPLSDLYSPSYSRAAYINTSLDSGFLTALPIQQKWLRDICSVVFSIYYLFNVREAEEKLRRFQTLPTLDMMRCTWEKTTNPILRLLTFSSSVKIQRICLIERPKTSQYTRPVTAYLFYNGSDEELARTTDLILDIPGGGFIALTPEHHEVRLRIWARLLRKPILSINYGKAPEFPYPFAQHEIFDVYQSLVRSDGTVIGMAGKDFNVVLSADSAGAALAISSVTRILEYNDSHCAQDYISLPLACTFSYAALDFNVTSWLSSENLRLMQEHSNPPSLKSPLKRSWSDSAIVTLSSWQGSHRENQNLSLLPKTMSSRISYYEDRIIPGSLMRSMATLYLGKDHNHDFTSDYYLSPILTPAQYLARFPPCLLQCGDKDPFSDDSKLFAARVREAKRDRVDLLQCVLSRPTRTRSDTLWQEHALLTRNNGRDWIQLDLFTGWSHGYLSMIPILPEAKTVAENLGHWINNAFSSSPSISLKV